MAKSRQDNYNKNVFLENEHMRDTQISNDAILLGRHYEAAYSKSKKSLWLDPDSLLWWEISGPLLSMALVPLNRRLTDGATFEGNAECKQALGNTQLL